MRMLHHRQLTGLACAERLLLISLWVVPVVLALGDMGQLQLLGAVYSV